MIRISAPPKARRGELVELKAMLKHEMESGYRRDAYGQAIPRHIIKNFTCRYNGELVFAAEFFPAIAANPLLVFEMRPTESGSLHFEWIDQDGVVVSETRELEVL